MASPLSVPDAVTLRWGRFRYGDYRWAQRAAGGNSPTGPALVIRVRVASSATFPTVDR